MSDALACTTIPIPDDSRTLRRTVSFASIDTVCPPKNKGIRRRIAEIAENLRPKSTKRKKRSSTVDGIAEDAETVAPDSKTVLEGKLAKRARKSTSPLRTSSRKSEEASVLAIADRLHSGVPFELELDPPLAISGCKSDSLVDASLIRDVKIWEDRSLPTRTLALGAHFIAEPQEALQALPSTKLLITDFQLDIRPFETDITIWDGLHAAYHVFKCRLWLRCMTRPYDGISLPEIQDVEMECSTCPPDGSHYTRPSILQMVYTDATPGPADSAGLPSVDPDAGIHMDREWCKIQDDDDEDGAWGWYRDAYVPLSPRLFDKMDHREFKLVSRVWTAEGCVEAELTFGISMLLRGVDMK